YQGVNLVYYGNQRQLEYDFTVAPGADASVVTLTFPGASPSLDADGNLLLQTSGGEVMQHAPVIYQMDAGQKHLLAGRYQIAADGSVHFQIDAYDHAKALVIDPVISYATYLGGSQSDSAQAIAVDGAGNAYITGG